MWRHLGCGNSWAPMESAEFPESLHWPELWVIWGVGCWRRSITHHIITEESYHSWVWSMKTFPSFPSLNSLSFFFSQNIQITSLKVNVTFCRWRTVKKQHLFGCVKKLLRAPPASCKDWQVDILQGKYVTRESRVRLTLYLHVKGTAKAQTP